MNKEIHCLKTGKIIRYNLKLTMRGYPDNRTMYYFEFRTISDCEFYVDNYLGVEDNFYYEFQKRIDRPLNVLLTVLTKKEL